MEILVINGSPKVKAKAGSAITDGMLTPYRKVLKHAEKESPQKELNSQPNRKGHP